MYHKWNDPLMGIRILDEFGPTPIYEEVVWDLSFRPLRNASWFDDYRKFSMFGTYFLPLPKAYVNVTGV